MFRFSKPRWETLKDKKVYETPIFSLHEKTVMPNGENDPADFYVLKAPEWINVLPITPDREIVLVEQYRHGVDETTLEIPGGMVDPGESPEEAARRELLEETGFSSENWSYLGKVSSNPAILTNFTHIYLADECAETADQKTDGYEDIKKHVIPLDDFLEHVHKGDVHHSIVLAAVAKYLLALPR